MRFRSLFVAAIVAGACTEAPQTSAVALSGPVLANATSDLVPAIVFNTQLRSELEVPACTSESKGHAQIKIMEDGTIESQVFLNNKGDESVRFGHIHHLNPGAQTGPIIWWLSSPIGTDLNILDRQIDIRQQGEFVANAHFADHAAGLAELLANPGDFYVNFHSDLCPGGVARGFLE